MLVLSLVCLGLSRQEFVEGHVIDRPLWIDLMPVSWGNKTPGQQAETHLVLRRERLFIFLQTQET